MMLSKVLKTSALFIVLTTSCFAQTIIFDGLQYNEVESPTTKRVWLDRNIGAQKACDSVSDEKCFGHYYQWGRKSDGHQLPYSKVVKKRDVNSSFTGHEFISVKSGTVFDWNQNSNDTLWKDTNALNNVCPKGYKIPTIEELSKEIQNSDFLKLSLSGYKSFCNGKLVQIKQQGALWSSTPYEQDAYYLDIRKNHIETSTSSRADAFPIRCIKQN